MHMDERARRIWDRFSLQQRTAFFSCLITGLLVHLYAFTNLIPNADGLSRVFDPQQMTVSGRWFLHYASALNNFTQMPAVIGLLSLLWIALAAALTVELLTIRSRVLAGLSGAVMAAFPCLGYTFLYMFTASAYCLAIFLAVLSLWLALRNNRGWLLATLVLALSMGIYQVYVTVAISLALLVVFREALDPEANFRSTLTMGLRLMAYLAWGAVLYYAILLIFLNVKDLELLSYLGMDAANSGYPFGQLPSLIFRSYKQVVAFFFLPGAADAFCTPWLVLLNLAALAIGALCCLTRMGAKGLWKETWRPIGALAMLALLPLGMNFGQIISPHSAPTPMMKYAFVVVYLAVLLLADLADGLSSPFALKGKTLCAVPIWAALILLFSLNTSNLLYTASNQAHRATESYATRLLTRIESCPGYEPGMEIAIVGAIPADQIRHSVDSYRQVDHYSVPKGSLISLNKHIYFYLNDWLNVPVDEPSEETMKAISDSPEFQAMPLYPADGSVQVLDGRVVVRVQEEYTPKSDYEIAYENRR